MRYSKSSLTHGYFFLMCTFEAKYTRLHFHFAITETFLPRSGPNQRLQAKGMWCKNMINGLTFWVRNNCEQLFIVCLSVCKVGVKSLENTRPEKTLNFPATWNGFRPSCTVHVHQAGNIKLRLPSEAAGIFSFSWCLVVSELLTLYALTSAIRLLL